MRRLFILLVPVFLLLSLLAVHEQRAQRVEVGTAADGGFLLNSGWRVHPAGMQLELSTLPISHALSPDGRTLAVLNGGYDPASVSLFALDTSRQTAPRYHRRVERTRIFG